MSVRWCVFRERSRREDGKRERSTSGGGGRFGYEFFLADLDGEVHADAWAKEAVRMALVDLSAVAAPAGTMPVVLGAGWPGVLLHEAVGHGLEGDFNRRGTSVFSGQVGGTGGFRTVYRG